MSNYDLRIQEFKELEQIRLILDEINKFQSKNTHARLQKTSKRRTKLGLYGDILSIISEGMGDDKIKLTRVQFRSNTSYTRLIKYLGDLEKKQLIDKDPIRITNKGLQFLREYSKIKDSIEKINHDFL